jgi:G:T-mismatch repair DNA endonuclease (very short patch repair protein)
MKLVVAGLVVLGLIAPARADEPTEQPWDSVDEPAPPAVPAAPAVADEPGDPGENGPAEAPRPAAPAHKARMSTNLRPHSVRRVEDDDGRLEKREDTVLGGKHFRIKTSRGAVHVWAPPDYDRETAGTVIYVHGYYTDADGAWREHELAKQFKASRQNALFIVPDAPAGNDQDVQWTALTDLRRAVTRANIRLPDGPVVVMGHSGAFRTVMQWVDHRAIDQIILLDALYAGEKAFDEFIASGKRADDHKLIVVAASTAEESASFARRYKFAVAREKMPSAVGGFTRRERGAKLLYVRSQFEHMAIVTSGKVIPMLLRVTPLKAL